MGGYEAPVVIWSLDRCQARSETGPIWVGFVLSTGKRPKEIGKYGDSPVKRVLWPGEVQHEKIQ